MNASPQGGSVDGGHSPAPWTVRFSDTAGYDSMSGGYEIRDANDQLVVTVDVADALSPLGVRVTWEEATSEHPLSAANARLIAAAPDLLAWLRAMVEAHGECMCRPDGIVCPTCRAEEVIAKATDERSEEAP